MRQALWSVLLWTALLLPACGPDIAPEVEVPSWAKVAPEQIAEAKKHGVPVAFENDLGMRFVLIPAGTFLMGSPEDEEGRYDGETQHEVTITKPYYMSIYEVTNEQYRHFDATHDSGTGTRGLRGTEQHPLDGPLQPVVRVNHGDSTEFCAWLSSRDPERSYQLPTEAQWEHACRAGTQGRYSWGDADSEAHLYTPGADGHRFAVPVGSYQPNPWGLYDMHGNVLERCMDWYGAYASEAVLDPQGPPTGTGRISRGRSWVGGGIRGDGRSAFRTGGTPEYRCPGTGFRPISPLPEPRPDATE